MAVNASSSFFAHAGDCTDSMAGLFIGTSIAITRSVLLLPLSILVLYLGHQRWRQQRSFATMSHSDVFTYHLAAMELIYVLGSMVHVCSFFFGLSALMIVGIYVSSIIFPGQMLFHLLTCGERYLAVVHPVTYLGLKQSGGVKIRNVSTVCVWLLTFVWATALLKSGQNVAVFFGSLGFSLIVVSFCSLRVLCVLIRPGPGEGGGNRERADQLKQRAVQTVMAIMGVLWLWFVGFLVCVAFKDSTLLSYDTRCIIWASGFWFTLPSSLVLPLLFLHRAGKLHCCH